MDTVKLLMFLITIIYTIDQCVLTAVDNTDDDQSFTDRIQTLQDETKYLCSYIEGTSLITTKNFIKLMQDAHISCPDIKRMEVTLTNIAIQADEYHSHVNKQSSDCKELLFVITKSLENGDMVDYYLKEGNYSFVTNTLDKWHLKFSEFKSKFYMTNTPLDIMLNNKKIFYYDNWIGGLIETVKTLGMLIISSLILTQIFIWIGFILWIVEIFSPPSTNSHQMRSSVDNNSLRAEDSRANSDNDHAYQRKPNSSNGPAYQRRPNPTQQPSYERNDRNFLTSNEPQTDTGDLTSSLPSPSFGKLYQVVKIVVFLIFLCGLIVITARLYPSTLPLLNPSRMNWYPSATSTLEKMRVDNDKAQSDVRHQISTIEKLQSEANVYHNETIQADADELVSNLGKASQQASKEISDLYVASKKLSSDFRQAHRSIKTKAETAGRLSEAKDLLIELEKAAETHDKYHRSFHTLIIHHQKLLPILKEQTVTMQKLVQEGHVMKIGHIANEHIDILMGIDNYTVKVSIIVEELIDIVGSEKSDGMKKMIEELKSQTSHDQFLAKIYGAAGGIGGTLGGTVAGLIALKSGYALVTITAATVAGPVAATAGALGLFGFAAYSVITNYKNLNHASRYITELDVLENSRGNFETKMKNLNNAITDQRTASELAQKALNRIASHSTSFSNKINFILPTRDRIALSNELLQIIQQYNTMIPIFNSFKTDIINDDHEHLLK